jgi:glycerol-3-phosphate O-acyltransferase/dihydroxyacetone phosphate acyltransferase
MIEMLYRLYRLLAWLMLRLFFRRIEVEGRALVPASGPILFVANHTNALVDPLVLIITLRRRLTLTAKNVLGRNPLARVLMDRLGIITFHRAEDVGHGADRKQNVRSLARCREILRQGGALCIFPEGVSHSDPHLRPFRTGAARIALDFVRQDGNPGRLQLIRAGLLYTEKDQFRSNVWLRFGPPCDVAHWLQEHPDADGHALTEEIRRRIEALTVNYEDRREELILSWGAQILASGGAPPSPLGWADPPLAEDFQLLKRLQAGYRQLVQARAEAVQALTTRVRRYRSLLKRLGIEPREVFLPMHFGKAAFFLVREVELMMIGAPLALVGALNHAAPYWIVKQIARKLSRDKDHWASNVVYPSFMVFPVCYAAQIAAAWLLLPAFWAGVYTITLPYTGYVALLYGDRMRLTWRRLRTFLYFLRDRSRQEELVREGRAIIVDIRALGEQLPQGEPSGIAVAEGR